MVPLSGCATLRSAQRPVLSAEDMKAVLANYQWPDIHRRFYSSNDDDRHGLTRRQYRDEVIWLYMRAIDSNYAQFRSSVESESRGSDFAFDLVLAALAGITSVAEADEVGPFAAAIATMTGAKGSFDKNLFFDKTLSAVLTAMDEERAKRRLVIDQGMQNDEKNYSIVRAMADLTAYQEAGNLSDAISNLTTEAVINKRDAVARLENAAATCDSVEDMQQVTADLRQLLDATDGADNTKRDIFAAAFGLPAGLDKTQLVQLVGRELNKDYCKASLRATKAAEIRAALTP